MERGGGRDQDRRVHQQRQRERDGAVNRGEPYSLPLARVAPVPGAGLHDGGVEVQVVRHDGGAQDSHGDVKLRLVCQDGHGRDVAVEHRRPLRLGQHDLHGEAADDERDQPEHQRLQPAHALVLQPQDQEGVERGEQHAVQQRDAEQQLQRDGGADQLGQVGGADGDLGPEPQRVSDCLGEPLAAQLRQVPPGGDADPHAQCLQQHGHQRRHERHGQQRVAERRSARERRGPVAGVHVADRHQVARPHEGEQLAEEPAGVGHRHAAMNLRQAGRPVGRGARCRCIKRWIHVWPP